MFKKIEDFKWFPSSFLCRDGTVNHAMEKVDDAGSKHLYQCVLCRQYFVLMDLKSDRKKKPKQKEVFVPKKRARL